MKQVSFNDIALQSAALGATGTAIVAKNMIAASAQITSSGTAAGTYKLQFSDDNVQAPNVPTNWTDIPSATASVTTVGTVGVSTINLAYQYIRGIYTSTATGAQHVIAIADTGRKQVQTVTAVADIAGSLNNKYYLTSSVNTVSKAQKNFYVWFNVSAGGTDPALPGKTGVEVDISTGDSANTVATAIRGALNALTNDFVATGAGAAVIETNVACGLVTAAADGAAPTGFAFANTMAGVASNLNNKYFLLNSAADATHYYVWFNVDTIGTDPAPSGLTACPVAITSGSTASTIGGLMATAIAALNSTNDFTAVNTTGNVLVTNKVAGPFTPASDFNTGFAFSVTTPSGTISAQINLVGY